MVEETTGNVRAVPREVSADAGYYSVKAVEELYALGANPFIAPEKTRHGRVLEPAPRGRIPKGLSVRDRMRRKLRTKRGRERYALRMETVEPVFGQIKQGRGFRQFLLRGLAKVNREWLLICAGHNLLKLFRFGAGISGNVRGKGATGNNKESCQAMGSGVFETRPGYVHPHHAGFVATGESWPINRVSWSILRQAPSLPASGKYPPGTPAASPREDRTTPWSGEKAAGRRGRPAPPAVAQGTPECRTAQNLAYLVHLLVGQKGGDPLGLLPIFRVRQVGIDVAKLWGQIDPRHVDARLSEPASPVRLDHPLSAYRARHRPGGLHILGHVRPADVYDLELLGIPARLRGAGLE